jgi:hypothetical protein
MIGGRAYWLEWILPPENAIEIFRGLRGIHFTNHILSHSNTTIHSEKALCYLELECKVL